MAEKRKSKEHKKLRKLKEGGGITKIKKKKDKKDKTKNRERLEHKFLKEEKDLNRSKEKDIHRKLKKEKKRLKQRGSVDSSVDGANVPSTPVNTADINIITTTTPVEASPETTVITPAQVDAPLASPSAGIVPKLTLKLNNCQSPTPTAASLTEKLLTKNERQKRELSPELARFSPLVTRPPKQKPITSEAVPAPLSGLSNNEASTSDHNKSASSSSLESSITALQPQIPPPSPWLAGGTLTASSVLLPQQLMQANIKPHQTIATEKIDTNSSATTLVGRGPHSTVPSSVTPSGSTTTSSAAKTVDETNRPASYIDAEGNRVWICPACGKVDDGSPMVGCDGCDAWYHWLCVGLVVAPKENEDWFCRVCITRRKGLQNSGGDIKKRKRNKKK